MSYKTRLTRIGNSRGVRIPYQVIQELGLEGELEMIVEDDRLIVQAAQPARAGWDAFFAEMAKTGDDELLDGDVATKFDDQDWTW